MKTITYKEYLITHLDDIVLSVWTDTPVSGEGIKVSNRNAEGLGASKYKKYVEFEGDFEVTDCPGPETMYVRAYRLGDVITDRDELGRLSGDLIWHMDQAKKSKRI